jgi:hypothetical protein
LELDKSGSGDLTQDEAERPDMFQKPLWNPVSKPNMFGWDSAAEELGLCRTCTVWEPDMSGWGYWNLA